MRVTRSSSMEQSFNLICRGVAQSGSASGLGPEGRRFESYRPDHFKVDLIHKLSWIKRNFPNYLF